MSGGWVVGLVVGGGFAVAVFCLAVRPPSFVAGPMPSMVVGQLVFAMVLSLLVGVGAALLWGERGFAGAPILGSGIIAFGFGSWLSMLAATGDHGDGYACISYISGLIVLSATCLLAAVHRGSGRQHLVLRSRPADIACVYGLALLPVAGMAALANAGLSPPLVDAAGRTTPLREIILLAAVIMMAVAAARMMSAARHERCVFAFWVGCGEGVLLCGLIAALFAGHPCSLLDWLGVLAADTGCLFMMIGAVACIRRRGAGYPLGAEAIMSFFANRRRAYHSLVETSPDATLLFNAEGRLVFWNAAAAEMFPGEAGPEVPAAWTQAIGSACSLRCEVQFSSRHPGIGDGRWVTTRMLPEFNGDRLVSMVAISRDVTLRRSILLDERRRLQRLRQLVDFVHSVLAQTTPEGLLDQLAQAARGLTDAPHAVAVWGPVESRFRWQSGSPGGIPPGGPLTPIRLTGLIEGGSGAPAASCLAIGLADARAATWGALIVWGHRELLEEHETILRQLAAIASLGLQHVESRVKAEEANVAKSAFLASMSHEIRTPMNAVLGMAELALLVGPDDRRSEYVRLVKVAGQNLLAILNDLLDLSGIEAGRLRLEDRPFVLRETLDQVLGPLASAAQTKGLDFHQECAAGVPEVVSGDAGRLRQVLYNLVGNAIKFTGQGRVAVVVELDGRTEHARARLRFRITDTGIGVAAEMRDHIFDSFAQGSPQIHARYGGAGLGLAIARQIVEMMNGRIWVESVLGSGSSFYFTAEFGEPSPATAVEPATAATE